MNRRVEIARALAWDWRRVVPDKLADEFSATKIAKVGSVRFGGFNGKRGQGYMLWWKPSETEPTLRVYRCVCGWSLETKERTWSYARRHEVRCVNAIWKIVERLHRVAHAEHLAHANTKAKDTKRSAWDRVLTDDE